MDFESNKSRGNIIIIDDDFTVRESLARFLSHSGYQCHEFNSPTNVLKFIQTHQEIQKSPSCIICDIKMSTMSGLEFQEALNEQKSYTPLILFSGASDVHEVATGFRNGAIDFLIKPVNIEKLEQSVEKALHSHLTYLESSSNKLSLEKRFATLTSREREVAAMIVRGYTNLAVSLHLNIALRTVKLHRHRALKKLGVSGIIDLVKISEIINF